MLVSYEERGSCLDNEVSAGSRLMPWLLQLSELSFPDLLVAGSFPLP